MKYKPGVKNEFIKRVQVQHSKLTRIVNRGYNEWKKDFFKGFKSNILSW